MAPSGNPYNDDWVVASNSNVHVANHRDWFTKYTPFQSRLGDAYGMWRDSMTVEGIGDVVLPVKKDTTKMGRASQGSLTLHNVLHVPGIVCNIYAMFPACRDQQEPLIDFNGPSGVFDATTGDQLAIIDRPHLPRLRLSGQSADQTNFESGTAYMINAHWPESEQQRWHDSQTASSSNGATKQIEASTKAENPSYTAKEKQWLKQNFGNEFHFLRDYGLSIYKEDKRAEGRLIARSLMDADLASSGEDEDEQGYSDTDEEEEEDEISSFEKELDERPEAHFADHYFTDDQLDWIEKHYKCSSDFLATHALKIYDDEDCREGVAIAEEMMEDEESDAGAPPAHIARTGSAFVV